MAHVQPVELAFRQRLVLAFEAQLGERVYAIVSPPEVLKPVATYRRLSGSTPVSTGKVALIGLSLRDLEYTPLKQLQRDIEDYFENLHGEWLGLPNDSGCSVWVYKITAETGQDAYQASTRDRVVSTVFRIQYSDQS